MSVPFRAELEGLPGGALLVRVLNQIMDELKASPLLVGGVRVFTGRGTPEGAKNGNVGDLYLRTDGGTSTTLYVKESGTGLTGWVAK